MSFKKIMLVLGILCMPLLRPVAAQANVTVVEVPIPIDFSGGTPTADNLNQINPPAPSADESSVVSENSEVSEPTPSTPSQAPTQPTEQPTEQSIENSVPADAVPTPASDTSIVVTDSILPLETDENALPTEEELLASALLTEFSESDSLKNVSTASTDNKPSKKNIKKTDDKEEKKKIEKKLAEQKTSKILYSVGSYKFSEEDIRMLAQAMHHEANNQSTRGKIAIVEVILNRLYDDRFPNTVEEVIFQSGQFSNIKHSKHIEPTEEELELVSSVVNGTRSVLKNENVLFFKNTWICNKIKPSDKRDWGDFKWYTYIEDHAFYESV